MKQFLASFYLVAVVPHQLQAAAGFDRSQAVAGSCLACCVGCILTGLLTDLPFLLAPPVAISIFFAVSLQREGMTVAQGRECLLVSGLLLIVLGLLPPKIDRLITRVRSLLYPSFSR